jgi:hypothetical protein
MLIKIVNMGFFTVIRGTLFLKTIQSSLINFFTFFVLFFITAVGLIFTGLLMCFHFYLYLRSSTTSEIFKLIGKPFWVENSKNERFNRFKIPKKKSLIKEKLLIRCYILKVKK